MTKTENYNLPQWEGGDPVRRTDFNAANQVIDAKFAALDGDIQAANAATSAAVSAAFSPNNLPYEVGSFNVPSGSETDVALVTFSFKPTAILFMTGKAVSMYNRKVTPCDMIINSNGTNVISVYVSGNTLKINSRDSTASGYIYYMAFR